MKYLKCPKCGNDNFYEYEYQLVRRTFIMDSEGELDYYDTDTLDETMPDPNGPRFECASCGEPFKNIKEFTVGK